MGILSSFWSLSFLDSLKVCRISIFGSVYISIYVINIEDLSLRFKNVALDYDKQVSVIGNLNAVYFGSFKKNKKNE